MSRYDVSGHAGGHLGVATAPFTAVALITLLLLYTPRARREAAVLVVSAAWIFATVLVLIGNVRVVDALVAAGHSKTTTDALVVSGTIESAHDLANSAPNYAVVAAMVLTLVLWRRHHISGRVAIGAAVLNIIVLPWIFPGGGVFVLVVARAIAYHRSVTSAGSAVFAEAVAAPLG